MAKVNPKRRAAKAAARNPRRSAKAVGKPLKLLAGNPGRTARGARLLGRGARGGTKLWAKSKKARVGGRAGGKALKAAKRARSGSTARTKLLVTGGIAAAGAYFLDPKRGKHRRDKAGKVARQGTGQASSQARHASNVAAGAAAQASSGGGREPAEARLNDPSLARKVETEIFREDDKPKGSVSVSVENGVVILRGQVDDSAQIERLATEARNVDGVRDVQNLLVGPGETPPAKTDGGPGSGAA